MRLYHAVAAVVLLLLYTAQSFVINNKNRLQYSSTIELHASNFWYSRLPQNETTPVDEYGIPLLQSPTLPYLDNFADKRHCRVGINLNLQRQSDIELIIQTLQSHLEAGYQTLYLPSSSSTETTLSEIDVLNKWRLSIPRSVWRQTLLAVPYQIPTFYGSTNKSVRTFVTNKIQQLYGRSNEALDTLVISYNPNEPYLYHLEVVGILQELQRDGMLRTIIIDNSWPFDLLQLVRAECKLDVKYTTVERNLLMNNTRVVASNNDLVQIVRNPLCHELLSNARYTSKHLSLPTNNRIRNVVNKWATRNDIRQCDDDDDNDNFRLHWQAFQREFLFPFYEMSRQHGVSTTTLALRWMLQQPRVGGVIVPYDLIHCDAKMPPLLHKIWSIKLDSNDMDNLSALVGLEKPKSDEKVDPYAEFEDYQDGRNGLYLPPTNKNTPNKKQDNQNERRNTQKLYL